MVLVAAALAGAGCTMMSQPPPVLPTHARALSFTVVEGVQVVPTRAVVSAPGMQSVTLRGRADGNRVGLLTLPFDPRLGFVHRFDDRWQWGAHLGWLMNGAELRYVTAGDRLPLALTTGAQVSSPLAAWASIPLTWDARVQLSAHPRLGRGHVMLGAGLSTGRRQHAVVIPEGPLASYGVDQVAPVVLHVMRQETRVEGLVGVSFGFKWSTLAFAAQPFHVVAAGDASGARCRGDCTEGLELESFRAAWGAVFTVTLHAGR